MPSYQDGRRVTDTNQGMQQFTERLTMEETRDLATYCACLGKK